MFWYYPKAQKSVHHFDYFQALKLFLWLNFLIGPELFPLTEAEYSKYLWTEELHVI